MNEQGEWKKQISTNEGSSITFQKNSEEEAYCFHQHFLLKYNVEFINLKDLTTRYITRSSGSGFIIDEKIIVTTYKSDDLDIPLTIIYNKEKFVKNANQPAMIKVYGGYGSIQEPSFDWENYLFVKNGGLLAFPGVRGSGAKGADWGLAGRGLNKQKTIDDVIAAAEYLVKKRYVKKSGLFLQGGSHGGFVVSAAAVQRPDLFRGVIVNAGVFDLLVSGQQSVGYAQLNREEYGDPTDSLGFINRLNLSPIHNLKSGIKYPSFLIITGSNDTRVPPSQSYRFMAALKQHSANEVNFLHVTGGGHNIIQFPKEDQEIISLKFKFLWLHTGIKFWKG